MGLHDRATPAASSAVLNGTLGAPATARLLRRAQTSAPAWPLQGSDGFLDSGTSHLDQNTGG